MAANSKIELVADRPFMRDHAFAAHLAVDTRVQMYFASIDVDAQRQQTIVEHIDILIVLNASAVCQIDDKAAIC